MRRGSRIALFAGAGFAAVLLLGLVALLVITQTDWGRERVRLTILSQLERATDGRIDIGRVEGNLLRRIRLIDVSIVDEQGRPFVEADTISTRFSVRGLLRRQIMLTDVRLVNPVVVLDRPPGEEWNYARIFRIEPDTVAPVPTAPGWGDWIELRNAVIVNGSVTVRTEWRPPPDLSPDERRRTIAQALAGETRELVVEVPGGYQNVMVFRELHSRVRQVVLAHPDTAGIPVDVARFSGMVQPFEPPAQHVRFLSGRFRLVNDSLRFTGVHAVLTHSRVAARGSYALESGELLLHLRGGPLAFTDMQWLYPALPDRGGGSMRLRVERRPLATRVAADQMDVAVNGGTLQGRIDIKVGDTLRIGPTSVRFANLPTEVLQRFVEDVDIPLHGRVTGRLAAEGTRHALTLDGDIRLRDDAGVTSRLVAAGGIRLEPTVRFSEMRLRFMPVHARHVRAFAPDVPVRGTVEGFANLTGSPDGLLQLDSDLTMRDPATGPSRVRAAGGIDQRGEHVQLRNLLVRMDPLRTDLLREWVPELPAGGTLAGQVRVDGTPAFAMQLDGDVTLQDPQTGVSRVRAAGGIDRRDELRLRNMLVRVDPLRGDLLREWAPDLPAGMTLVGQVRLDGAPAVALQVDGDFNVREPRTGLSRVGATGGIVFRDELRLDDLLVRMDPLQLDLLRDRVPDLPAGAELRGAMRLDGVPQRRLTLDGDLALRDPRTGTSRFGATGGLVLEPELRFDDLLVRMHAVQLALLQQQLPELPDGVVTGAVTLNGAPARMLHVDGDIAHDDPRTGRSEVGVRGGIAMDPMRFDDLRLRLEPLRMRLVQGFVPDLPVGGLLRGTATLNGSPAAEIEVRGDIVHVEAGERSHVVGSAVVATGPGGRASVDVALQPLSLNTVGRFVPAAGLHGSVSGALRASGRLDDLRVDTDLRVAGGGAIRAEGRLDLAGDQPGYSVTARMSAFNLAAVTWRAPARTDLTGNLTAAGRGTEPATMNARIAADLVDSEIDDVAADRVRLRVAIAGGLAEVDSSVVRLGTAEAVLDGSFGLTPARHGTLAYVVRVDSLHAFAPWIPGADTAVAAPQLIAMRDTLVADTLLADTAIAAPPPAVVAQHEPVHRDVRPIGEPVPGFQPAPPAVARPLPQEPPTEVVVADAVLGADSALIAAATGVPPVPRDSLAGRLFAAGTLRGNIHAFDVDGRAEVEDFVYGGTSIGRGRAEYALANLSTDTPDVRVNAHARDVVAAGLAFDSVSVDGEYLGARFGTGRASIVAFQDDAADYRLDAEFMLSLERNELRLADAALRFDTVTWTMAQPGVVSWGEPGIEVDNIELVSNTGGRIFADGTLPADGAAELRLEVENLGVAQLVALAQGDVDVTGRLDLAADITGTAAAPLMEGTATITQARVDGGEAPDVRATFSYAGQELTAEADMIHDGRMLADATARLPLNLALTGDVQQRLLPGPIEVDIRADSLPIEAIPALSEHVEDARGRVSGAMFVRGTFESPLLEGAVNLDLGSLRIVLLGVRFDEVAGTLTLAGTTVTVDSLVAVSGGPLRIDGEIDVSTLSEPVFDLVAVADNAQVIDNGDMRLRLDADVTIAGPLSALQVRGDAHARSGMLRIPRLDEIGSGSVVALDDPATFERVDTALVALRDQLRPPRAAILQNIDVDVALTLDRDFWLRSSEANVEIYTPPEVGPLRIGLNGGQGTLTLLGTINTDRGEYEFLSRRFRLTRGAVTFSGEADMDPFIQLAAEHEVRLPGREAFAIRVVIDGLLSDFAITLESTSQPPISQTDLLSYVAFGRDASSLLYQQGGGLSGQGTGAGELVGNVAGLATQQLAAVALEAIVTQVEADAARELRLDVFRIMPADLPAEVFRGDYTDVLRGTEIEAGRYISPRLFFAGQIRGGFTRPGVRLEYWSPGGLQWRASWQPRFVPNEPTLTEQEIRRRSVLGAFLFREWRF